MTTPLDDTGMCLVATASGVRLSEPMLWSKAEALARAWRTDHPDEGPIWVLRIALVLCDDIDAEAARRKPPTPPTPSTET